MTPAEAGATDHLRGLRQPQARPDAATAWAMALDGLRFEDCRDAIVSHYRASREWIMPARRDRRREAVRTGRLEDVAPWTPPPGMDPDDTGLYARWLAATRRRSRTGSLSSRRPTRRRGRSGSCDRAATGPSDRGQARQAHR
jgi:hypothetical protein